jgi:lysozyme
MLTCSDTGINLIKTHEGVRLTAYLCPANRLTIGYGHVLLPKWDYGLFRRISAAELARLVAECQARRVVTHEAQVVLKIRQDQADALLAKDVQQISHFLNSVLPPLNQHQFDALVSFVFNIGQGQFATSTLRKKLQFGDMAGAAKEFDRWVKATDKQGEKVTLPGLVTRRAAERALFEQEA